MAVYDQYDPNDPFSILNLGQQYNPYQGYPLKQVSDQVWDLIAPTPDYLVAQQFGAMTPWRDTFSTDAFFAADPLLRGPLAQALSESEGDSIEAYSRLQSEDMRRQLLSQIGRTEWDELERRGNLDVIAAITPEEKDQAALDFYMSGLEDAMVAGAPTSARNMQQYDFIAERMGGRPYPGAGGGYPEFGGPGFGGGGGGADPLADLAGAGGGAVPGGGSGGDYGTQTAFGEGIVDVGEATGEDRLDFSDSGRYAVIGGRRYQLPDTMAGPQGRSPAYQNALRQVMRQRLERQGLNSESGRAVRAGERRPGDNHGGFGGVTSRLNRSLGLDRLREVLRLPNMISG